MTNAEQQRTIFWTMFDRELEKQRYPFCITHRAHYATVNRKSPNSDYCLSMDFLVQKGFLRIGIYMREGVFDFETMLESKAQIEQELGFSPMWTSKGEKNPNTRRVEVHLPIKSYNIYSYQRTIMEAIPYVIKFMDVMPRYLSEDLFDF